MKFIDIPEKKTTVAIQSDCYYEFIQLVEAFGSQFSYESIFRPGGLWRSRRYTMPDTYKTVVVCRDGDEYSIEEGRRQAAKKLEGNKKRSMVKRAHMLRKDILKGLDMVDKWLEKNDPNFVREGECKA